MSTRVRTVFVCWTCGCSDARRNAADLPARCPGHDREAIEAPDFLDNCLPEYVDVHLCGNRECEAAS